MLLPTGLQEFLVGIVFSIMQYSQCDSTISNLVIRQRRRINKMLRLQRSTNLWIFTLFYWIRYLQKILDPLSLCISQIISGNNLNYSLHVAKMLSCTVIFSLFDSQLRSKFQNSVQQMQLSEFTTLSDSSYKY